MLIRNLVMIGLYLTVGASLGALTLDCGDDGCDDCGSGSYTLVGSRTVSVWEMKQLLEDETGIPADTQAFYQGCEECDDGDQFDSDADIVLRVYAGLSGPGYRNYDRGITASEKRDVHFVITTMANKPVVKLALYRKELIAAGDRIDSVHPLRFLMCIFGEEETKVALRVLRNKGWAWSEFMSGLAESLDEEAYAGNITNQQIKHFSASFNLDPRIIYGPIKARNWEGLVDALIKHIPRDGDSGRYDM